MIYKLKCKLKPFSDWFFMGYFLPVVGCVAMGISSAHIAYKLCFLLGIIFLTIKVWVTDYEKHEIIFMGLFITLLGYILYRTTERSLIITAISIFGCKNVNVKRVLKYTLSVYILGMGIRMGLAWINIMPGEIHELYKGGIKYSIDDFGFSHPNSTYSHLLSIVLMIIIIWGDKLRWFHYGIMSFIMFAFYKILLSRTGFLIYIIMCLMIILLKIIRNSRVKSIVAFLLTLFPLLISTISYILIYLYPKNIDFIIKLNSYVTGRLELSYRAVETSGINLFGSIDRSWSQYFYVDNAYINLLLGYGIIATVFCILYYTVNSIRFWKKEEYYILSVLAVISIYAFMEYSPVNVTWNPLLLYLSYGVCKPLNENTNKT